MVVIDGVMYVKQDVSSKPFCIVRTLSAGVFAGYLESRCGQEVFLSNAIRLWSWKGAASLSQLSQYGTSDPDGCKFAVPVDKVLLLQAIEILYTTNSAQKSIEGVKPWKV